MTNYQTKISAFIVVKSGNFCLRVCHPSLFDWNFFKIGSVSVKDIRKNDPILRVGGSSPVLSTPPVVWVVLLHKRAGVKSFLSTTLFLGKIVNAHWSILDLIQYLSSFDIISMSLTKNSIFKWYMPPIQKLPSY